MLENWLFYMLKLSDESYIIILFLNHFLSRETFFGQLHLGVFLPRKPEQVGANRQTVSLLSTADT
jgi:hypothetical protein